jgi:hypothetical protein
MHHQLNNVPKIIFRPVTDDEGTKKKRVAHKQVGTEPKKVKNEWRDGDYG